MSVVYSVAVAFLIGVALGVFLTLKWQRDVKRECERRGLDENYLPVGKRAGEERGWPPVPPPPPPPPPPDRRTRARSSVAMRRKRRSRRCGEKDYYDGMRIPKWAVLRFLEKAEAAGELNEGMAQTLAEFRSTPGFLEYADEAERRWRDKNTESNPLELRDESGMEGGSNLENERLSEYRVSFPS